MYQIDLRKELETWIIFFKRDLKISEHCHTVRAELLKTLSSNDFSWHLVKEFQDHDVNEPMILTEQDRANMVAAGKKVFNALLLLEQAIQPLENLNIGKERYLGAITADVLPIVIDGINKAHEALQLLDETGEHIQGIVLPMIAPLKDDLYKATQRLQELVPQAGVVKQALEAGIAVIPTEEHTHGQSVQNLSDFISELPQYFDAMSRSLNPEQATSSEESATFLRQHSRQLQEKLTALSTSANPNVLDTAVILKEFVAISAELTESGGKLAKESYQLGMQKLFRCKYVLIPQLIAGLENVEEELELRPGRLTDQIIRPITEHYQLLADGIIAAHGITAAVDSSVDFFNSKDGIRVRKALGGSSHPVTKTQASERMENLDVLFDYDVLHSLNFWRQERLRTAYKIEWDIDDVEKFYQQFDQICPEGQDLVNLANADKEKLQQYYNPMRAYLLIKRPELANALDEALKPNSELTIASASAASVYELSSAGIQTAVQTTSDVMSLVGSGISASYNYFFNPQAPAEAAMPAKSVTTYVSEVAQSIGTFTYNQYLQYNKKTFAQELKEAKSAILMDLQQEQAQDKFKMILVGDSRAHADEVFYTVHKPSAEVIAGKAPRNKTKANLFKAQDLTAFAIDHKAITNSADVIEPLQQLKEAEQGVVDFFYLLATPKPNRELLRQAFAKFQTVLVAEGCDYAPLPEREALNDALVSMLDSNYRTVQQEALDSMEAGVSKYLMQERSELIQARNSLEWAEVTEPDAIAASANKVRVKSKGLFEQISDLQLSTAVKNTLEKDVLPYIFANTSPVIQQKLFGQVGAFDTSKLPFDYATIHNDGPQVACYKNLLNAMYHLKQGLQELEEVHGMSRGQGLAARAQLVIQVIKSMVNIAANSIYYANAVASDPKLNELMKSAVEQLRPLCRLPIVGSAIQKQLDALPEPQTNIVELWQQQQKVVQETFAEYEGPKHANRAQTKKQGQWQHLALDRLKGIGPLVKHSINDAFKKAKKEVKKAARNIQQQIVGKSETAAEDTQALRKVAEVLYKTIPNAIDVFKPGTAPSAQETDTKMQAFIDAISNLGLRAKTHQSFLNDSILALEKQLIAISQAGGVASEQQMKDLLDKSMEFIALADDADLAMGFKLGTLAEPVKVQVIEFYSWFIQNIHHRPEEPHAKAHALEYCLELTGQRIVKEHQRLANIDKDRRNHLVATQQLFGKELPNLKHQNGVFDQLRLWIKQPDAFKDKAVQLEFLRRFEILQPYLYRIQSKYNLGSKAETLFFLRGLQGPENYLQAAKELLEVEPLLKKALEEGVEQGFKTQEEQVQERLQALTETRVGELMKQFEIHFVARLSHELIESYHFTPEQANQFAQAQKSTPPYLEKHFRRLLKDKPETLVTVAQVEKDCAELSKPIINKIKNEQMLVLEKNKIAKLINAIGTPPADLCRAEKLQKLQAYQARLQLVQAPPNDNLATDIANALKDPDDPNWDLEKHVEAYDALIASYDKLNTLQTTLKAKGEMTKLDELKLQQIDRMQGMLTNADGAHPNLATRFEAVIKESNSELNQKIMSDDPGYEILGFIEFVKRIFIKVFNIKQEPVVEEDYKAKVIGVKQQLQAIKESLPEPAAEQGHPTPFNPGA